MALGDLFKENKTDISEQDIFTLTGGEKANARLFGMASGSIDGVQKSGLSLTRSFDKARQVSKEKARNSTITWLTLLNEIQAGIDALEQPFKDEFGENYIDAMAQRFLTEEEYNSVATAAEREQLLYEKYLENGEIKEGLGHSDDAQWIKKLYEARPQIKKGHELAQKLTKAHAEHDGTVPDEIVSEVQSELEHSGLAATISFDEKTNNDTADKIYEQAVDETLTNNIGDLGNPNALKF